MSDHGSPQGGETAALDTHRAGEVLAGRYVLERPLHSGGMGILWVARSMALDVPVALKLLRPGLSTSELVERMANEAHAAATLHHPAIVRAIDFGQAGDEPFIAMELLEGEDLSSVLERETKLSPERAVSLLLPIVEGLAAAHRCGVVHRDVKPENIFIARDPFGRVQPKVLDFGIAKVEHGLTDIRLTHTGALLGTPQYLSPEQAHGRDDIDFATDVWSIGVVLYELVVGRQPFEGRN